jgi:hypothetical protein
VEGKDVKRLPIRGHLIGIPPIVVEVVPYNRTGWMASVRDRPEVDFSTTPSGAIAALTRTYPNLFEPGAQVTINIHPDDRPGRST